MSFTCLRLNLKPPFEANAEIVSGLLSGYAFSGFEFSGNQVIAYVAAEYLGPWMDEALEEVANWTEGPAQRSELVDRNWNEEWEKHYYQPLLLAGTLWIRGSFHPHAPDASMLELTVDPKMSFGTGHHPTTALVAEQLLQLDVTGKAVCDMGCGTGILAMLTFKLGAASVLAIDFDPWSVENTKEHLALNQAEAIEVLLGDAAALNAYSNHFDVFIANIQKSIIMHDVAAYVRTMKNGAMLLVSGFFTPDLDDIRQRFAENGLNFISAQDREGWCCAAFIKP